MKVRILYGLSIVVVALAFLAPGLFKSPVSLTKEAPALTGVQMADVLPNYGACCLDGKCQYVDRVWCLIRGGHWIGGHCEMTNACDFGCCYSCEGTHIYMSPGVYRWECDAQTSGVHYFSSGDCSPGMEPWGVCVVNGACVDCIDYAACSNQGGYWVGSGIGCGTPKVPCCVGNGMCLDLDPIQCAGAGGFAGSGINCATTLCP